MQYDLGRNILKLGDLPFNILSSVQSLIFIPINATVSMLTLSSNMLLDKRPQVLIFTCQIHFAGMRQNAILAVLLFWHYVPNLALSAYFGTMRQIWCYAHILALCAKFGAMRKNPRTYAPHANTRFAPEIYNLVNDYVENYINIWKPKI